MSAVRIAAFPVAIIVIVVVYLAYHRRLRRDRKRLLGGRVPVTAGEFGNTYYGADPARAEIATFVLLKFEELTGHEFTGAIPQDRIVDDLTVDELDSLATVEIIHEVEKRFGINVSDAEAASTQTLGDFIELVATKHRGG